MMPWKILDPCARYVLRANPQDIAEVAVHYGWQKPERMLRACQADERITLWLGPDEWLLLGEVATKTPDAARPVPMHSWVDVSDRQVALEIAGDKATDLLASGCPRDLALEAFAVGDCTRTVFGRSEIVLWRTAEQSFRLECWRSFLPYVQSFLSASL